MRSAALAGQKIPDKQCGYRHAGSTANSRHAWGGHRYDYETEALIIARRKRLQIQSVPNPTVSPQVSKIHPVRDSSALLKMLRRYKAVDSIALIARTPTASR